MQTGLHFHRRNLPHIYIPNATYFITFRLAGSIPNDKLKVLHAWKNNLKPSHNKEEKYKQEAIFFLKYDKLLHATKRNEWLKNKIIAKVLKSEFHKYDEKEYDLICYSIMPNHVHMVFSLLNDSIRVDKIMQKIKRISAFKANKIINKSGKFWQAESYDHIVRDEDELEKIVNYVLYNPVKAKLVDDWREWELNYFKYWQEE